MNNARAVPLLLQQPENDEHGHCAQATPDEGGAPAHAPVLLPLRVKSLMEHQPGHWPRQASLRAC